MFFTSKWLFRCLVVFVSICAVAFSLYHLEDSPAVWFDEGIYLHIGRNLAEKGVYNFEISPGQYGDMALISVGYPLLFPLALFFTLFGTSLLVGRLLSVLFILGFFAVSFIFIKKLFGNKWIALASFALLATFSALYGHGKNVLGEVPGICYTLCFAYFFLTAERNAWHWKYVASFSFFLGLAIATKPTFLPLLPALGLALLLKWRHVESRPPLRAFFLGLGITGVLLYGWIATQFSHHADLHSVVTHYANPYNDTRLLDDVYTNLVRLFTESTPLHFMVVFSVVFLYTVVRWRKLSIIELTLTFFAIFILISYLRTPGWYRYFFPGHVVMLLMFPGALLSLCQAFQSRANVLRYGAPCAIVLLFLTQLAHIMKEGDRYYSAQWRQVKTLIEQSSEPLVFYNVPEGMFFAPKPSSQVLMIRPGLTFGEDALSQIQPGTLIVARGSTESLEVLKKQAPGIEPYSVLGNYSIYKK